MTLHSIEQIKAMLLERVESVAQHYAPPAPGSYIDRGDWFTLNPGRADKSVGSFVVHMHGPRAGTWKDFATGDGGDLLDLIRLARGGTIVDALREARLFLGLSQIDGAALRARERAAEDAKRRRQEAERAHNEKAEAARRYAHRLWLSGQARIEGTPVARYLAGRGIDLAGLPRPVRALRYVPQLPYRHVDPDTGEVIEGRWPAMVAMATDHTGTPRACHRTWLALQPDGRVTKAPVPVAKKVVGNIRGAAVNLWRGGDAGPRGGEPPALRDCAPGSHVYISEGIEDALSAVMIDPGLRVLAAYSLSNLGAVQLPRNVSDVTLIADNDLGQQAKDQLRRAIEAHQRAGRRVRVWQARDGKDLNEALQAAAARRRAEGAA
jgi:hypothetical protein